MQLNQSNTQYVWKDLFSKPGEHKLFQDKTPGHPDRYGRLAIADNSGYTPDKTEDGVLWVDPIQIIALRSSDFGPYVRADLIVFSEREQRNLYTNVCLGLVIELVKHTKQQIMVDPNLNLMLKDLSALKIISY